MSRQIQVKVRIKIWATRGVPFVIIDMSETEKVPFVLLFPLQIVGNIHCNASFEIPPPSAVYVVNPRECSTEN